MDKRKAPKEKGFPLAKFNYILEIIVLVVAVFLLVTTFMVNSGYRGLKDTTEEYIECESLATDMELSSDKLTKAVRFFVESPFVEGKFNRQYLDDYFEEIATDNRQNIINAIEEYFPEGTDVYKDLYAALDRSTELENREYYAMRLTLEGCEVEIDDTYPEKVRDVVLSAEDRELSSDAKKELARNIVSVTDPIYSSCKESIEENINLCHAELIKEVRAAQDRATGRLDFMMIQQRIWLSLFIVAVLTIVTVTSIQIIRPLSRAVPYIRNEKTIPVSGAAEFRLLAKTYNRMYQINQTYREQLLFKANHDQLTGVLNRAGIEDMLKGADLNDAALLIVDVDNFKKFNDQYGHETGDKVLYTVAQTLQKLFRAEDVICRMGGDEFAIVMWHVGMGQKELIANKILRGNGELNKGVDGLPPISISVGIAFGSQGSNDLFHHADQALFEAKRRGRNTSAFYGE